MTQSSNTGLRKAFLNIYSYGLLVSIFGICSSSYHACFNSSLSTLEKRYRFSSSAGGYVMITDNIATVMVSLIIGHYGKTAHKPYWMSMACIITGFSIAFTSAPYFLFGSAADEDIEYAKNTTFRMASHNNSVTSYKMCLDSPAEVHCDAQSVSQASMITSVALFCFGISNFFRGIGTCIFFTYAAVYLDDNVSKAKVPAFFSFLFAARLFGAPIGLFFSSLSLRYYENPFAQPPGLNHKDPTWIGAWWIGFLFSGTVISLLAIPVSFFPRDFKNQDKDTKKINESQGDSIEDSRKEQKQTSITELPKELFSIISNPLITCQMLGNMFRGIGLLGYFVFMTKYIEQTFRQSASRASLIVGSTGFLGKITGVLLGGILISCFRPGRRLLTSYIFLVETSSVFALIYASTILGPQYIYPNTQIDKSTGLLNLYSDCNSNCHCEQVSYQPVCDAQGSSVAFFSPCHAGCRNSFTDADDQSERHFTQCSCIPEQSSFHDLKKCSPIDNQVQFYATIVSIGGIISGSSRSGNTVTLLRSIRPEQKTLTLALNNFWMSLAVSIPYPIVYGKIFDWSCLVWRSECNKKGNCWLYDTERLRTTYHGISIGLIIIGSFFDLIMIFLSPRLQPLYDDGDNNQSIKDRIKSIATIFKRKSNDNLETPGRNELVDMKPRPKPST